jgi:hypothetical protein
MNRLSINRINTNDQRFCITYPLEDALLYRSIQRIGIVQPVILLDASPFVVVTGFKRIEIAHQLGLKEIPYVTVNITEHEGLLFAIHDNIRRGLNLVEKAHAVERMLHLGFSREEMFDMLNILGMNPHEKILKMFVALASAEDSLKHFIVSRDLSLKNVDYLLRFEVSERTSIINLLSSVHVSESSIREILEILSLLKLKHDNLPFTKFPLASNSQDLIKNLKEMAYPLLTSLHKQLQDIQHALALPPNIDIKVDPFFEKEYIDIGIRAKNQEDINQALEKLHRLTDDGILRRIFDLTKGNLR